MTGDVWGDRDELDMLAWDERLDSSQLHDEHSFDVVVEAQVDVEPLDWWLTVDSSERAAYRAGLRWKEAS